ncbi:hypothetical protein EJ02DRAFT_457912 [Clathrospora elynae]|uniref:Transcription factor CBF/NF-Y/archaeal histone domain-containing protein n=1 Tax=Clathrospora elynae TaxID=706981 RepID=A0A6A5SEW9_9PLEO|nr:hypothetical protein EJ02DRAFT_457912 [Clathrospora elynae]
MPYNNTPIAPPKEITGHVSLPLARVQKIIVADPERITTSKNAAFAIALATEMFIQHLSTTTHNVVKAERKPRRNIQYRDVSSAIAKTDNLEFLVDVVPKTTTYGNFKKRVEEKERAEKERAEKKKEKEREGKGKNGEKEKGQTTLNGAVEEGEDATSGATKESTPQSGDTETEDMSTPLPHKPLETPEAMEVDDDTEVVEESEPEVDAAAMQIEMEMRGPPRQPTASASPQVRRSTGFTAINGSK